MDLLTIGEMAKINKISPQTLRFYEKIGLLQPEQVNPETKYRYYSIKQSARLDMIQHMKSLGMDLKQIKEQLDKKDINIIQHLLEQQNQNIDYQIKQLLTIKNAVQREIDNLKRYKSSPKEGVIVLEYIPERWIYLYESNINFYDYGIEAYEYMLRELKNHLLLHSLPIVYFCNVGSILRKERLEKKEFVSTEIFLFVDDSFNKKEKLEKIEANTFLCIYCDSFYKEKSYANKLLNVINEKGYTIIGDYICEVVAELPVFMENERNMFIKLQIPVKL